MYARQSLHPRRMLAIVEQQSDLEEREGIVRKTACNVLQNVIPVDVTFRNDLRFPLRHVAAEC